METSWASENLQVIRTLMERTALYRRALAPIMIVTGSMGLAASTIHRFAPLDSNRNFSLFWMAVSLAGIIAAFLLVRRQALKDAEPFWSSPTRRVTEALIPGFLIGLVVGVVFASVGERMPQATPLLALLWIAIYGCALHAAGFFMERGIRMLGTFLVLGACAIFAIIIASGPLPSSATAHHLMGIFFGALHLAYGIYLYFTEKRRNAT
jgi:FtsH-binding integral membrane protein